MTDDAPVGDADTSPTEATVATRVVGRAIALLREHTSLVLSVVALSSVVMKLLAVAEGWHRGPTLENPTDDPVELGPKVAELVAQARPNANMFGYDEK